MINDPGVTALLHRVLKPDVILGAVTVVFALVLLLLWIPNDIKGEVINVVRRRKSIGDPMAPTLTGILLLLCGAMLMLTGLARPKGKEAFSGGNAVFVLVSVLFLTGVVGVMLFAGPVLVTLLGAAEEYRQLRATLPWKYVGFLLGGFVLLLACIGAVERRISLRTIALAIAVPLVIALLYDLPFDDTLLPPNGDY